MIDYNNIPEELRNLNQWVCANEDSKVPMRATSRYPASSTNPATWSSFDEAMEAVRWGYYDYLGFVFNDNGIVGIDIDDGFDDYGLSPIARDIVTRCYGTYIEYSKSGNGLHIFVKGDIPFTGKNNLTGVEIYKTSRFFIMTGNTYYDCASILNKQDALNTIVDKYFPETREQKKQTVTPRIYNPQWECPRGNRRVRIKPNYPVIPDGCRNICLTSLAGMMHSVGYTKGQIYRELQYANETACKPPLEDGELRAICNSITRYRR